jgi:integrase
MYLDFESAALAWLETRRNHVEAKTLYELRLNIKTLNRFFRDVKLTEITSDLIRKYQRERQANGLGASTINHETSALQQMLRRIGHWAKIEGDFQPLPLPKWQPGRIITLAERERLFRVSASDPNWEGACLFSQISVGTTAGPREVLTLRLMDVFLNDQPPLMMVQAEGAKRPERIRPIPLKNKEALSAMVLAVQRAERLGANQPEHYIFPYRIRGTKRYDPTRHQRTFRSAWAKVVKAAKLDGLKMYDLRRTAITDLLGDPMVAEETVRKICGHVGKEMLKRYSYNRLDNMGDALERLGRPRRAEAPKKPTGSAGTFALPYHINIPVEMSLEEKKQFLSKIANTLGLNA